MKKPAVFVFIFIIVLAAAVVISFLRLSDSFRKPEPTPPPAETGTAPVTEAPPVVETPDLTEEPTPEPTVEPTPEPTPTPPPTVPPEQPAVLRSGSFRSETGTNLNLVVSWRTYSSGGGTKLDVEIGAESYSLFTSALPGSVTLTVNGSAYTLSSPDIAYDGQALTVTPLCSKTVDVTGTSDADISVSWSFRGSYGGVELEELNASSTVGIG